MATRIEGVNNLRYRYDDLGGSRSFAGQVTFSCPRSSVVGEMLAMEGKLFPGIAGADAPVCIGCHATFHPGGQKDRAYFIADYESPRKNGKARLYIKTARNGERLLREPRRNSGPADNNWARRISGLRVRNMGALTGRLIQGTDEYGNEWRVVRGDNMAVGFTTVFELQTAYPVAGFSYNRLHEIRNTCNETTCRLLGGVVTCKPETLACIGINVVGTYGEKLVYVNFDLAWSGDYETWNEKVLTAPSCQEVIHHSVYGSDGEILKGVYRSVVEKMPFRKRTAKGGDPVDAQAEARRLFVPSGKFTMIAGLAQW